MEFLIQNNLTNKDFESNIVGNNFFHEYFETNTNPDLEFVKKLISLKEFDLLK